VRSGQVEDAFAPLSRRAHDATSNCGTYFFSGTTARFARATTIRGTRRTRRRATPEARFRDASRRSRKRRAEQRARVLRFPAPHHRKCANCAKLRDSCDAIRAVAEHDDGASEASGTQRASDRHCGDARRGGGRRAPDRRERRTDSSAGGAAREARPGAQTKPAARAAGSVSPESGSRRGYCSSSSIIAA
jgi:hypothetical protein